MFSTTKYELVKALHASDDGYVNEDYDEYDNVIGQCYERFFVAGCLYEKGEIQIPCFGCQEFYRTPEQFYLVRGIDLHDNKTFGYRIVDTNGFGFWSVELSKQKAIAEACEIYEILPIQIKDLTCDEAECIGHCGHCEYEAGSKM